MAGQGGNKEGRHPDHNLIKEKRAIIFLSDVALIFPVKMERLEEKKSTTKEEKKNPWQFTLGEINLQPSFHRCVRKVYLRSF